MTFIRVPTEGAIEKIYRHKAYKQMISGRRITKYLDQDDVYNILSPMIEFLDSEDRKAIDRRTDSWRARKSLENRFADALVERMDIDFCLHVMYRIYCDVIKHET